MMGVKLQVQHAWENPEKTPFLEPVAQRSQQLSGVDCAELRNPDSPFAFAEKLSRA